MRWATETDPRLPSWLNTVLNSPPFLLPMEAIIPLLCLTCGFLSARNDRLVLARVDRGENPQMYSNGALMIRLMFPFWIGIQVRWSGAIDKPAYLQMGIGWKLNGRFAITFRIQDDLGAAAGVLAPNTDQSIGWHEGGK
ncbi:MAG: hypothetical protein KGH75_13345 [Rhodospirillales bacterium]|nr:hypothetical protein [Rhodospirillales bacterium]